MLRPDAFIFTVLIVAGCGGYLDVDVGDGCLTQHQDCLENPSNYVAAGPGSAANCVALLRSCRTAPSKTLNIRAREFKICSDQTTQGTGQPCVSTSCAPNNQWNTYSSIGMSCWQNLDNSSLAFSQTFTTSSADGENFHLWMRIYRDDATFAQHYDCSITRVSPDASTQDFSFTTSGFRGGLYGAQCAKAGSNTAFCWALANNMKPIKLLNGEHTISCTCNNPTGTNMGCGYDGLIFQTSRTYEPDAAVPATGACNDDDLFTAGTCFGNWGPNL